MKAVIEYIERLTVGQGRLAGQAFTVMPWQSRFIRGALSSGVVEACLSLARGGGKSTLISAIGCAALDGPLMQPEAEILIVASSHEQGQIIYRHVLRFMAEGIEAGRFRTQDTVNTSRITNRRTGTMLSVKGSDPKRLHGAAPSLILADEISQWPAPRIDEMLSALRTAGGKIPDAKYVDDRHAAQRRGSPVRGRASRRRLLPDSRGVSRGSSISAPHLEEGKPRTRPYARPGNGDPSGGEGGAARPFDACTIWLAQT